MARVSFNGAIVFVAALLSSSAAAQSLTDALSLAYQHNPQLLAERAQLRSTDEQMPQAVANWRPSVQITASQGFGHEDLSGGTALQDLIFKGQLPTTSYGATVTEPIFRGWRTVAQTGQARDTILGERAHLASVEQSVLLQAITDYADVARDEAALTYQIDNEQLLAKKLVSVRGQFAGGALTRLDVVQTEADHSAAVAQRRMAEASLDVSRANFLRDVGILPQHLVYPKIAVRVPQEREKIMEAAERFHPDVVTADYKLRAAREAVTQAWGQALPTIDVQGQYNHQDDAAFHGSRTDVEVAQVRLTWNLYEGGAIESQTRQAEQTVSQYASEFEAARQKAGSDAISSWSRLQAERLAASAYKEEVGADELALTGTEAQQRGGERTILDVLNAQRALVRARVDYNTASHDEVVEEYTFAASLGTLSAHNLRLAAPIYDPTANFEAVADSWFGFGIGN